MAFDGFVTRGISLELKKLLVDGRIEKIYHINRNDLIFVISKDRKKHKLMISTCPTHFGIYIVENTIENPPNPTSFCMLLRKHLSSGKIRNIKQVDWERIIEISVETTDEMGYKVLKTIVVEIMNKHSNIILLDNDSNKIIDALKRVSFDINSVRQVLPSMEYTYPPKQDKMSPEEFLLSDIYLLQPNDSFTFFFDNISAISKPLAMELSSCNNPLKLLKEYIDIVNNDNLSAKVYMKENVPKDFHIIPLNFIDSDEIKEFASISSAISYFYENKITSNILRQKSSDLEKKLKSIIKKLRLKKSKLLEDLENAKKGEKYKLYGELLTANLHLLKDTKKSDEIEVFNYYTNDTIKISLSSKLSPLDNAQMYFKKYNKSKRALVEKDVQLNNTQADLDYLNTTLDFLTLADSIASIEDIRDELIENGYIKEKVHSSNKRKKRELLTFISPNGFTVYVGRNNKENDYITTRFAHKNDIWFHTKDISGSHTLLVTAGAKPKKEDLEFTASLAAYYSKGRMSENVPVDYTLAKFVKKPKGAKAGMVIYTDNSTLYVMPKTEYK